MPTAPKKFGHIALKSLSHFYGITYSMPFWDEVFSEIGKEYEDVGKTSNHIDALAAFLVMKPDNFDVIVASNLFGDILTDLGAIMGSIQIAPAANINTEGVFPSIFEPVHGSTPDIAGQGIANPIGQIWTGKMMLDFLGYEEAGTHILNSIESTLTQGIKTPDLGGTATLREVTDAVLQYLESVYQ